MYCTKCCNFDCTCSPRKRFGVDDDLVSPSLRRPVVPDLWLSERKPFNLDPSFTPAFKPLTFELPETKPPKLDFLEAKRPKVDFFEEERRRRAEMRRDSAPFFSPKVVRDAVTGREIGRLNPFSREITPTFGRSPLKVDLLGNVSTVMGESVGRLDRPPSCFGTTVQMKPPIDIPAPKPYFTGPTSE